MAVLPRPTDEERFHAGVLRGSRDECWEWQRCTVGGYGTLNFHGKTLKAHRVAWMLANGPIPDALCVLHRCDNPRCCNPAHLWLGDWADNNADKETKGRAVHPAGEAHVHSRLTAAQVVEIRHRYGLGGITQPVLGALYGVSRQTISAITRGENWKSV